jgi:hypothetical protein
MPLFNRITDLAIDIWFSLLEFKGLLNDIFMGYYNYWRAVFNLINEDEIEKHDIKADICTKACPLQGKMFGVTVCDFRKEHDGERGCGCVISAKLWSDSPCPLGKF